MTEHGSLAAALAAFQLELPTLGKGNTANVKSDKGSYTYRYADLADVSTLVLPALGKHGLSFSAMPTIDENGRFVLEYTLRWGGTASESVTGRYPLPTSGTPQQVGSAITYARRYALCAITGVAPDEDDDGKAAAEAPVEERGEAGVTQQQHRRMHALWNELGYGGDSNRNQRLAVAAKIVGMEELVSSASLTARQAGRVIAELERKKRDLDNKRQLEEAP